MAERGAQKSSRTRSAKVAELLKARILTGEYPAGAKLAAEPELARELDVHRMTLREALNQLEQLRLIERNPGTGTVVLDYVDNAGVEVLEYLVVGADGRVSADVLANALEFARILSSELGGLAALRRDDEDLAALYDLLGRMRQETVLARLLWLDFDFNQQLAKAARNIIPRLLLNAVRGLLHKYTPHLETLWVSPGSITEGYEAVVSAIRAGDDTLARATMKSVWEERHRRFVESIALPSEP